MEPYQRLDDAMRRRRLALGMRTWRELAERASISYETLRALRAGANPSEGTEDGLERALGWSPGSIRQILRGEEPILSSGRPPADDVVSPELRARIDRILARPPLAARLEDLIDAARLDPAEEDGGREAHEAG